MQRQWSKDPIYKVVYEEHGEMTVLHTTKNILEARASKIFWQNHLYRSNNVHIHREDTTITEVE